MSTAIEFNNISKLYRLGLVSSGTLSNDLKRWWTMNILHKEDPFMKVGSINDRSKAADSEYVWALKDIDFKVEQGDVVGIIGKNGAGKSTLLKLLSRVTGPTTGAIKARGRIGALLEVGTGFHSELTGRENIYMNGSILGMTKTEITRKLDEIIGFSGCERYIDTPVKRYSSGMMVRLGFAVAAHLDPEILVVDEVLAVGDAEFQKKAIGKMQDVSKGEGRTVLFVSHNMGSIARLCTKGVVLNKGSVAFQGTQTQAIDYYLNLDYKKSVVYEATVSKPIQVCCAKVLNNEGKLTSQFFTTHKVEIAISTHNSSNKDIRGNFAIVNSIDQEIMVERFDVPKGDHDFLICFDASKMLPGVYSISLALDTYGVAVYDLLDHVVTFDLIDIGEKYSISRDTNNGIVSSFVKTVMLR